MNEHLVVKENHIFPFFWMKGEDNLTIREELDRVEECGIKEICLESRPHPDFCGPGWWDNLDFILMEARKRNMRVWILDDDKFPTGHCNGGIGRRLELKKLYLAERHVDIIGPCKSNALLVENFLAPDGELLGILAFPKPDGESLSVSCEGMIDLTNQLCNGFVYFDLPEGAYRLFVLYTTRKGGGREDYMNLIDKASVRVLIDEVYEKHYAHYKDYFGTTLAGFFSDEPELGNIAGYPFDETLGKKDRKLPWSNELHTLLRKKWGEDFLSFLPCLWYDTGTDTRAVRSAYMNELTKLVQECFSKQIGNWCKDHFVEYIGHIIEDDNAHTRLGCSIGHYFREMKGQHMSGIDVVHHQIVPGFTEPVHQWIAGDRDGEFFHFGLGKLGSSAAHIDGVKKNRAMCEIFGNYGWAEGNSLMKWLTNHMLVRGINYFTPHAFSMKYPDRDCPPHFYARGENPGFECFRELMKYMERGSRFLSRGIHQADAAILYHAEAEWTGGKTMYFHKPGRVLMEAQLDYDVIPADCFINGDAIVENSRLFINEENYPCFILPYGEYVVKEVAEFIIREQSNGLTTIVIDNLPIGCTNGDPLPEGFQRAVKIIELTAVAEEVRKCAEVKNAYHRRVRITEKDKGLRKLIIRNEEGLFVMWFNENLAKNVNTVIQTDYSEEVVVYDPWTDTKEVYTLENGRYPLSLFPGEARFLLFRSASEEGHMFPVLLESKELLIDWQITRKEENTEIFNVKAGGELPNLNGPNYWPGFSGTYHYKGNFCMQKKEGARYRFVIPEAGDCLKIVLNGKCCGYMAGFPSGTYIEEAVKDGDNVLELEISTTLVWKRKDGASTHIQVPATGLTKPPVLECYV